MTTTSFHKITKKILETAPPGVINNGCGNKTVPAWTAPYTGPSDDICSFQSYEESSFHYDPSKGRSFRKAVDSGQILMSEYLTGTDHVTRSISSINRRFTHASYTSTGKCSSTQACAVYGPIPVSASWTENYHIGMLSKLPHYGKTIAQIQAEVPDLVTSTRQSAYSQALNAYDLLTELGELRETLGYLMGKIEGGAGLLSKFVDNNPLAKRTRRMTPKQLSRSADKAFREMGSRWMEYRYALMPIIYSINDIDKVLRSMRARFKTDRSIARVDIPITQVGLESQYLTTQVQGYCRVASVTKASFQLGSLQRLLSSVGINPFRTTWELIPLSFVVDWFFNIGNAITALTGIDYSSQRQGCTSVRSSLHSQTFHHYDVLDRVQWTWPPNACGFAPPPWDRTFSQTFHNVVEDRVINSYVRSLWLHPSTDIIFDPFLNWKRFIDSLVLGYQPTKNLLRSLR